MLTTQAIVFQRWFAAAQREERQANLEFARAVAFSFQGYIKDVLAQELATGSALTFLEPYTPEQAQRILAKGIADHPAVTYFAWLDPEGRVQAANRAQEFPFDINGSDFYERILHGREWVVTDVLPASNESGEVIVARAIREEDDLKGVMVAVLDLDRFDELARLEREHGGRTLIFDGAGFLVHAYPPESYTYHQRNWIGVDPLLPEALAGRENTGTLVYPNETETRISARVPIPDIGWVAGVSRPESVALGPVRRTLMLNAAAVTAVSAIGMLLAVLIAWRITRGIRQLTEYATVLARGGRPRRNGVTGVTELEDLADEFDLMAGQIRERQEALQHERDELDTRVQCRTAELLRSNADLARYAELASHDLQEPLRMVGNFVQLLKIRYKGKLDEEADVYIDHAVEGATRMHQLLRDLLDYSQIDARGGPFEPIDSGKAAEEAAEQLGDMIDQTGTRVAIEPLPRVAADRRQLVEVFRRLIENGIKFRREGVVPEVHLRAELRDDHWVFSVRDNGIGIEPEYFDQIFVIFKRLNSRLRYPGTGVGLAMTQRIVARHGGRIWVESEFGKGSTFFFSLPIRYEP